MNRILSSLCIIIMALIFLNFETFASESSIVSVEIDLGYDETIIDACDHYDGGYLILLESSEYDEIDVNDPFDDFLRVKTVQYYSVRKYNEKNQLVWSVSSDQNELNMPRSMGVLSNGNIIVYSYSYTRSDGEIICYDAEGKFSWKESFFSLEDVTNYNIDNIVGTSDGGFIGITGKSQVIKFDQIGGVDWISDFTNKNINEIIQLSDGSYAAVGTINNGSGQMYILKMDSVGRAQWEREYGGPYGDSGNGIVETPYGNIIAVGTYRFGGEVTTGLWAVSLDVQGELNWSKSYNMYGTTYGIDVEVLNGEIYLVGTAVNSSALIVKIDNNGNEIVDYFIDESNSFMPSQLIKYNDSLILFGNTFNQYPSNKNIVGYSILRQVNNDKILNDYRNLTIGYANGDSATNVTRDVALQVNGINGSSIQWMSSDDSIVNSNGEVIRPIENSSVILTAKIIQENEVMYKKFPMLVVASENISIDYMATGVAPDFLDFKWDQKGFFWWKSDDTSKPPIDVIGSSEDYVSELKKWANYYSVLNVAESKELNKILDKKVNLLANDTNGQKWFAQSKERTIRDLIEDIVYLDSISNYLSTIDEEFLAAAGAETSYWWAVRPYGQEKDVYNKYIGYMDQLGKYLQNYSDKDSFFVTLAAPFSWKSVIALNNGEFCFINQMAELKFNMINSDLVTELQTYSSTNNMNTYKSNVNSIENIFGTAKYIYEYKTGHGDPVLFAIDMFDEWAGDIQVFGFGDAYSSLKQMYNAVRASMMIGSSIGLFPYIVDLYFDLQIDVNDTLKAWYFFSDYYIYRNFSNIYTDVIGDNYTVKSEVQQFDGFHSMLEAYYILYGTTAGRNEYMNNQNNKVLVDWEEYLTQGFDSAYRIEDVRVRRNITNVANLYYFINNYDTGEAKYNLVKYISAELNKQTTFHEIKVDCPVIVKIYDNNGALLETLSPDNQQSIQSMYGSFYLLGDAKETKYFIINSDEYYFEIEPFDSGTMNITISLNKDGNKETAYYNSVVLDTDMIFIGKVLGDGSLELTRSQGDDVIRLDPESDPPLISIRIDDVENEMNIGETQKLNFIIEPVSYDSHFIYSSSDESIATVDSSGIIRAVSEGKCTVVVKSSETDLIFDMITLIVNQPITAFSIDMYEYDLHYGESINLNVSIEPLGTERFIAWRSTNSSSAYVDSSNVLHGISSGEAIIEGFIDELSIEIYVKVQAPTGSAPRIINTDYEFALDNPKDILMPVNYGNGDTKASFVDGMYRLTPEGWKSIEFNVVEENIFVSKETLLEWLPGEQEIVVLFDDIFSTVDECTINVLEDTTPPIITIGDYLTEPTNQDVVVYAYTNEGWLNYDSYTFTTNAAITFIATDDFGNESSKEIVVDFIDKESPIIEIGLTDYGILPLGTKLEFGLSSDNGLSKETLAAVLYSDTEGIDILSGFIPDVGVYMLNILASDEAGNTSTKQINIVIYDPEGGFVTGGGWINSPKGAYTPDYSLFGKATFGFVSKYKKGVTVPSGQTQFIFNIGNLQFYSTNYNWMVVAGSKAQFKGEGTINGQGEYGFMLTAIDGGLKNIDMQDRFRIKIWDIVSGDNIYDNQFDSDDSADLTNESTAIGGGSIVIHK